MGRFTRDSSQCSLKRYQLRGRGPGLRASEVSGELDGARRVVFRHVGAVHSVLQMLAPRANGAHGDFATINLDSAAWLLKERAGPASRFQAPRPHEDASFHHHSPDPDETMRLRTSLDAQDLTVADCGQDVVRESSLRFHARAFLSFAARTAGSFAGSGCRAFCVKSHGFDIPIDGSCLQGKRGLPLCFL